MARALATSLRCVTSKGDRESHKSSARCRNCFATSLFWSERTYYAFQVRFLGHPPDVIFSQNILGRVFRGDGTPIDGGVPLAMDERITIGGPSVNPVQRKLASNMIRTDVAMIDVFNCLVESQEIPIFSVSAEPYNQLLARVGIQADADVVVFGGLGMLFECTFP
jgi:V/A-type H+-transporting ATPase subunit B